MVWVWGAGGIGRGGVGMVGGRGVGVEVWGGADEALRRELRSSSRWG